MELDTIITGDSAIVLQSFPDACIDLTVTSPPYDNLRTYNGFTFDFETIAKQLYRVTKVGGVVVWVVGDATVNGSETGTSFKQALYFMQCGFNLHDTMIWDKTCSATHDYRNKRYKQEFEYMFILGKGKPKTYNEICDRKTIHGGKVVKKATHTLPNGNIRQYPDYTIKEYQARANIWRIFAEKRGLHPAPFPEALAHDHIISWSNEGNTVLDCFTGSGTTLKMAKLLNRHYIGIEMSAEYVNIAKERLCL